MSQEYEEAQMAEEGGGMTGPGAPTPLSALEVGKPESLELRDLLTEPG